MWLKLTATQDNSKILINFNNIVGVMTVEGQTILIDVNHQQSHINEDVAEIELMLKGAQPALDPRARSVIGRDSTPDNELSESDWNLRYNEP